MCVKKLNLKYPTFEEVKETLRSNPDVIEIMFRNQEDNSKEFEIIYYLVNRADYCLESLIFIDDTRTNLLAHFKRNK